MLNKLRVRLQEEKGFTLVELLVVMLILGLLAAIAIPAFFNQRDKARDADSKTAARTAQTAIETFATDNDGSYAGAGAADLIAIENTLTEYDPTDGDTDKDLSVTTGSDADGETYEVNATSPTGNDFSVSRAGNGSVSYTCNTGGDAGCPSGGTWD